MDVVLIGAGGHGKVVLDILRMAGGVRPIGFLDANEAMKGTEVDGLPVLGGVNLLPKLRQQKIKAAIVSIGGNRVRQIYAKLVLDSGMELINAVHPAVIISTTAKVGRNVVVAAGAIIGTDAIIGDSSIINTGAIVDHECEIGEGCHICPGAMLAGRVRVGTGAFVGLGAKVIQCLSVGEYATIGAGAVVIRDIPAHATAVGVPARILTAAAVQPVELTKF
ncbi:MAG TPA: acetyltransferase [Tepidisphaeraceae bacterium]|jgi:UDP-perosamine 4-acetyltransferase